ncbi:DNA-directed RNA polymerase subunit omega [Alkaliphilus sp. MSJ-5]|uniref:DNA-directed RNA polymerase subunit omega n=1 Tax=Alkaliphilus flagellatus TaxID=2841507 RepID=A0ABS6G7E3_9FIRM|nr:MULTISPECIES: DNA-directed RNA polymerase subunit omega [Alkaliphilus]MBU5677355.1 DNA-directed RNA polymerase subunit omega [Alkaliphilus flagellatus]QUH20895.1 DNA-directed RNA polymerase subunit omega [Alkaliphilus sp. B6464]
MLYPPINELLDKVDSRYTLVVAAAKRARQLIDGDEVKIVDPYSTKPVSIATQEIFEDQVLYTSGEEESN